MKINPLFNAGFLNDMKKTRINKAQEKTSVPQGSDEVSFSKEALSFAKTLSEAREAASPQRQARVADLTEQVRSGQYQVDAQKVAEKIVDSIVLKGKE